MSAQIEQSRSHFVRFPDLEGEKARQLARALDFEASAGRAVIHGELREAEDWRTQARDAWTKYAEASR